MPWIDFPAVKGAVSLEAVLNHYQLPGLRRPRRQQVAGRCPIHWGRREDSFRAHLAKNVFHCFACQAGGNVLDFVAAMEKCSIREAALKLQDWFALSGHCGGGTGSDAAGGREWKVELVREQEGWNPPLGFALTGLDFRHPYLQQRGIDPATALGFGVGFYARAGLLSGRIVIPIRNCAGELVAYAGRAVDGEPPKYKLPPGFRKALELFNRDRALATGSKTVIVVEGYFDCLRVHQAGFPSVVALMGSSLSRWQEMALLERFQRILLMLDGDATGRSATRVISARLSPNASLVAVPLPDGAQPDQLSPAVIQRLLSSHLQEG